MSEHSPDWWVADVSVVSRLKGQSRSDTVPVIFNHRSDVASAGMPRFTVDDQGIWILQAIDSSAIRKGWKAGSFTVLDSLDFQALGQRGRIARLLTAH